MDFEQAKKVIKHKSLVIYKNSQYRANRLISDFDINSGWKHSIELIDLKAKSSVLVASIEECNAI